MKMPTTTNNKIEAKLASPELGDAAKQCINCLEKKVRNLEKRKSRIEQNREKAKKGTKLEKEQEVSLNQYEQVAHDLEFARELHKQFLQIYSEHEKMSKKQAKREKAEKQAIEIKRISEILQLQTLLDCLGGDQVREDFKTGKHGAVVLTEDNLRQLDELYQVISPSKDDSGDDYPQKLITAAEHLVNILEGKDRQIVGTTYKEIKELITLIKECGYFERAKKADGEEVPVEVDSETNEEFEDTNTEPATELPSENILLSKTSTQQQPIDLTMASTEGAQPHEVPAQPLDTHEQDAFFAPSSTVSYQVDNEAQYSQPSHVSVSRVPDFQSFTHNRPFQFIQASYIMPDASIPVVVDPAVIAAQPVGASGLQFISQGFDASSTSQKQQELPHSNTGMQHQPPQEYSSQSYSQVGLQQNDNLYSAPGVDESNQISSHPGMMGHIGEGNGVAYEIPPTIPMPPSQSQDQSLIDQQQQDKKFQMNASAPVFQSMYNQTPGSQPIPVSGSSPPVDQQVQTSNEFSNTTGGDYGQQGEFQQNYQGNNGFQQNYRGRGGFRSRGGNNGNRGNGSPTGPVQNGFSSRGGTNISNSRGGRGGSYQNFQTNNSYRSENFAGSYTTGSGYQNNFPKRGMSSGSTNGGGYVRGGTGGSTRGANNGAPRGAAGITGAQRGGNGTPRGSTRGAFRPQTAQ